MEEKIYTTRGLKYLIATFFTLTLYILFSIVFFFGTYTYHMNLPYEIIYILMVLAIIGFFVGAFFIWKGRNEISEKHINNVDRGLWLIIIFLVITTFSGLFLDRTITSTTSFFISSLMIVLASFYFLKNISGEKIKNIIWIAIFLFVIFYPLKTIVTDYLKYDYYVNLYDLILQILSLVIPYILFTICYYKSYKLIKDDSKN